jgi:hypothetical protein
MPFAAAMAARPDDSEAATFAKSGNHLKRNGLQTL